MMKLLAVIGMICFCSVQSRSYLPRDMEKYENYNDAYIDQLRDKDLVDSYEYDSEYDPEDYDYSGDDSYSDEDDDDEDRDYREWMKEREENRGYSDFGRQREQDPFAGMEDDWDPYYEQQQRRDYKRPSAKMDVYGRPVYDTKSAYKTEEEVMRLRNKLSDMQNEINGMKGLLRGNQRQRYPYRK